MLIVTFDVLAYPTADKVMSIGARQPSHEARKLWHALYNQYHGNLIIMATGTSRADLVEGWAKLEGYKYAHIDNLNLSLLFEFLNITLLHSLLH